MSRSRVHCRTATSDSNKPVAPGLFLTILSFIIFALGILVLFAKMWSHRTWPGLTVDEMVYHLTAPVEGTGSGIFTSLFLQAFFLPLLLRLPLLLQPSLFAENIRGSIVLSSSQRLCHLC